MNYKKLTCLMLTGCMLVGCAPAKSQNSADGSAGSVEATSESAATEVSTEGSSEVSTTAETTEPIEETPEETTKVQAETETKNENVLKGEKVTFSVAGGFYTDDVKLALYCPEGATIKYTTDGSDPRSSKTAIVYSEELVLKDRTYDENVVSAVPFDLFDTAHAKYMSATKVIKSNLKNPTDGNVDKCHVVKAVYETADGQISELFSQTYFIGAIEEHISGLKKACDAAGTDLAVISITANYDDFFDYDTGIYVKGATYDQSWMEFLKSGERKTDDCGRKLLANYSQRGREWEREVYVDFYEVNPESMTNVLSQSCGIRIQGNYSRSDAQKGFRLYARSDYGEKNFKYSVFGEDFTDYQGETLAKYKTLILRNGGNCAFTTKFSDTYWQSLLSDMDVSTQKSRPAVVYLNGEYWGLYVLEEDYSTKYFESHYGVNSDDVVLYKGDAETYELGYKLDLGELPEGEKTNYYYKDLLEFFRTHKDAKTDEAYNELCSMVDAASVIDYFAVECWINNKWDWPGKNWSMWRTINTDDSNEYADGKWRFCLYDVEFGGVSGGGDASVNTIREDNYKPNGLLDMDTSNPAVLCFAYMMTNEGFRTQFYDRLNYLTDGPFSVEAADAKLKEFESVYGALLPQFFKRYPGTGSANDALNGGYASASCIRDFFKKRPKYIQKMIDYAEKIENK